MGTNEIMNEVMVAEEALKEVSTKDIITLGDKAKYGLIGAAALLAAAALVKVGTKAYKSLKDKHEQKKANKYAEVETKEDTQDDQSEDKAE